MENEPMIPQHCAEKFERISRRLSKIDPIAEDVRILRRAVVGNGEPNHSLSFRLEVLERRVEQIHSSRRAWFGRFWRACVSAAMLVLGWWLGKK